MAEALSQDPIQVVHVHENVVADHQYAAEVVAEPGRQWTMRMTKEWRLLRKQLGNERHVLVCGGWLVVTHKCVKVLPKVREFSFVAGVDVAKLQAMVCVLCVC